MRKRFLLLSGIGIGTGLLYAFGRGRLRRSLSPETAEGDQAEKKSSMRKAGEQDILDIPTNGKDEMSHPLDDLNTNQHDASQILKKLRDDAFESSDEKLALALGRPTDEIEEWTRGSGTIDSDVVIKARGIATQRGVEV